MAKKAAPSKKKQKEKETSKSNYTVQFLFYGPYHEQLPPGYLAEFAGKIRTEHVSQAEVCCLCENEPDRQEEHRLIRTIVKDREKGYDPAMINDGYVVILGPSPLERQVNPTEFFRLPLPEEVDQKIFYEISFRGKNSAEPGGLIIPSDVVRYVLATSTREAALDPALLKPLLSKLGFEKKEVVVHQDTPFGSPAKKVSRVIEKLHLSLAWNTTLPLKEARTPSLRNLFFYREHPLFRLAFLATALAIFLVIPILSLNSGLSGDDEKHYQHAIKVYKYFTDDDPSALDDPRHKLNYYGQSFDFFTYLLIRLFNLEDAPYEARHVMVGITGAATILFTGLLVRLFAGYSGGWLALVLMFFSPRFLGHAFNNPMDVPFALGNVFTIYFIIIFLKRLPKFSLWPAIWIAVGIGWTNGIRIGGLLMIPYLFMFSGLYLLLHKWPWKFFSAGWWKFALRGLGILFMISVAGYLLSILTWPYALQDIINHPMKAFKVMTNIQVSIRVLYDGAIHWSDNLPWHYIPLNVFLTVPVLILLGWFASAVTWILDRRKGNGYWYFMLWFTILFPVIFIIYRESNVYGGWRHMMFIYPSMLALSAMAITSLLGRIGDARIRIAAFALVLAGMIHPVRHVIKNHPNTYIYFNEWSGGINRTYGTFETDYYGNSLKPASDYFIREILPTLETSPDDPVKIVSNMTISYYFRNYRDQVKTQYSRYYDKGKYDWDYALLYCNYIHPYQLNNGLWPPRNTIHEIKVDDVVVAAIVERKDRNDHLGSALLAEGMQNQDGPKLEHALAYLESAVAYDPNNESAYLELGNAYSVFLRFDEARSAMDHLLGIYPSYDKALNLKGYSYLVEAEVTKDVSLIDEAIRIINMAVQSNYKYYSGYYNLGLCYGMKNDRDNAEYNFKQAIKYNGKFKAAYLKLADLYEYFGDTELANLVREQASRIP